MTFKVRITPMETTTSDHCQAGVDQSLKNAKVHIEFCLACARSPCQCLDIILSERLVNLTK